MDVVCAECVFFIKTIFHSLVHAYIYIYTKSLRPHHSCDIRYIYIHYTSCMAEEKKSEIDINISPCYSMHTKRRLNAELFSLKTIITTILSMCCALDAIVVCHPHSFVSMRFIRTASHPPLGDFGLYVCM